MFNSRSDEHLVKSELNHAIINARADYYLNRFNGVSEEYPWGGENYLRGFAATLKLDVVGDEQTRISAIATIYQQMSEDGEDMDDEMIAYLAAVRRGEEN